MDRYNGGCTYLGWGEYVGRCAVVKWVQDKKATGKSRKEHVDRCGVMNRKGRELAKCWIRPATIQIIVNRLVASVTRERLKTWLEAEAQAKASEQAKRDEEARQAELARQEEEARVKGGS